MKKGKGCTRRDYILNEDIQDCVCFCLYKLNDNLRTPKRTGKKVGLEWIAEDYTTDYVQGQTEQESYLK